MIFFQILLRVRLYLYILLYFLHMFIFNMKTNLQQVKIEKTMTSTSSFVKH